MMLAFRGPSQPNRTAPIGATVPPDRDPERESARQRLSLIERKLAAVQRMLDDILALARADQAAPLNDRDEGTRWAD